MDEKLLSKYEELKEYIASLESVAVAFSSGADSTFLLYAAKEALGDKIIAVTASASFFPKREFDEADAYCKDLGISQFIVNTSEMEIEGFTSNPKNRCYLCKKEIFKKIKMIADEQNIAEVIEGSNLDDNGDYRPGHIAIKELDIKSPLRHVGLTKQEIRDLSKYLNIPTWSKPSFACLASRFPYGEEISKEKLEMVEKSEQLLLDMGFTQLRVRIHGDVARIELPTDDFARFMDEKVRTVVYKKLVEFGFNYVSLDIVGFRSGSMNEAIGEKKKINI